MPNARKIWLADMDALIALCEAETAWVRDKHRPKSELEAAGFDAPLKKTRQGQNSVATARISTLATISEKSYSRLGLAGYARFTLRGRYGQFAKTPRDFR